MLETVREFGLERLAASDEAEERRVRAAHTAYVLDLTNPVFEWPFASGYAGDLTRLDAELDNIRAALEWAERTGQAELGLRLAGGMGYYWMMRGHFREGRDWLDRALRVTEAAGPALDATRARALNLAGALAAFQGESDAASALLTQAIRLAHENEDWLRAGMALGALSLTELQRGNYAEAIAHADRAISLLQPMEGTASAVPAALSRVYANLGRSAFAQGDGARAAAALEESLAWADAAGFTWGRADTLRSLGDLARERGDYAQALAFYRESVDLAREHGDPNFLALALAGIAVVAVAQERLEPAVRLTAAAAALRERVGVPVEEWQRATYDHGLAQAQSAMAPETFSRLWGEGLTMAPEVVFAEALAAASPSPAASDKAPAPDAASAAGLTPRETEVLRLLADGLSDREIAEALFLSPRTVGWHVTHVLTKLEVPSRTAAVAAALRLRLI